MAGIPEYMHPIGRYPMYTAIRAQEVTRLGSIGADPSEIRAALGELERVLDEFKTEVVRCRVALAPTVVVNGTATP